MGKIVREHYPVEKLPEDLREGLVPGQDVRVTVEEVGPRDTALDDERIAHVERPSHVLTLEESFALRRPTFASAADVDAHVRAMRDEWD